MMAAVKAWLHRQWWGTPEPRAAWSELDRYYAEMENRIRSDSPREDVEGLLRVLDAVSDGPGSRDAANM